MKKYKMVGMSIFEEKAKEEPLHEHNRKSVDDAIEFLAENHKLFVANHGASQAVHSLFIEEVAEFYDVTRIAKKEEAVPSLFEKFKEHKLFKEEKNPSKETLVIYPTVFHEIKNQALTGVQIYKGFILNDQSAKCIDTDYKTILEGCKIAPDAPEEESNAKELQRITAMYMEIILAAANTWLEGHELNQAEKEAFVEELTTKLLTNKDMVRKEEAISSLIQNPKFKSLEKLLASGQMVF